MQFDVTFEVNERLCSTTCASQIFIRTDIIEVSVFVM